MLEQHITGSLFFQNKHEEFQQNVRVIYKIHSAVGMKYSCRILFFIDNKGTDLSTVSGCFSHCMRTDHSPDFGVWSVNGSG